MFLLDDYVMRYINDSLSYMCNKLYTLLCCKKLFNTKNNITDEPLHSLSDNKEKEIMNNIADILYDNQNPYPIINESIEVVISITEPTKSATPIDFVETNNECITEITLKEIIDNDKEQYPGDEYEMV
jgi:hypothetical protein